MIPTLNELVGLPAITPLVELGVVSERYFQSKFGRVSEGDVKAQRDVVALRVAILNWAYAGHRQAHRVAYPEMNRPASSARTAG